MKSYRASRSFFLACRLSFTKSLASLVSRVVSLGGLNKPTMHLTRHAKDFFVGVYSAEGALGEGGKENRGIFLVSLQLAFKERVVPATQAFDWSLDNRC